MKYIIFDFNRTLYDPDSGVLMLGAADILPVLKRRGYTLYLLSRAAPSRSELLESLGLKPYFSAVAIVENKNKKQLRDNFGRDIFSSETWMVGDRVRSEIGLGKALGFRTIWLRQGKFSTETPRSPEEFPDYTVISLHEILEILT